MVSKTFLAISSLAGLANAHFTISYPEPRGPFVDDAQTTFCGQSKYISHIHLQVYHNDSRWLYQRFKQPSRVSAVKRIN